MTPSNWSLPLNSRFRLSWPIIEVSFRALEPYRNKKQLLLMILNHLRSSRKRESLSTSLGQWFRSLMGCLSQRISMRIIVLAQSRSSFKVPCRGTSPCTSASHAQKLRRKMPHGPLRGHRVFLLSSLKTWKIRGDWSWKGSRNFSSYSRPNQRMLSLEYKWHSLTWII